MNQKTQEPESIEQLVPCRPCKVSSTEKVLFCFPRCFFQGKNIDTEEASLERLLSPEEMKEGERKKIGKILTHRSGKIVFEICGNLFEPSQIPCTFKKEFIMEVNQKEKTAEIVSTIDRHIVMALSESTNK